MKARIASIGGAIALALIVGKSLVQTPVASPALPVLPFFWFDWDAVDYPVTGYTIYLGEQPGAYVARIPVGNQTSAKIWLNHPVTFCAVAARTATQESPRSAEVSFTNP